MPAAEALKLDAGRRTLEFVTRYPDGGEAGRLASADLSELVAVARRLIQEQLTTAEALDLASRDRDQLARPLRDAVALIVHFGSVAALRRRRRDLRLQLRTRPKAPAAFLTEARSILRVATGDRELLTYFGMPVDLLPRLTRDLDRFESAVARRARAEEVIRRVRADLAAIAQEMYLLIRRLDIINRRRFAGDPEMLALWIQARAVQENRGGAPVA
jgi:hypothetical protein